MTDSYGDSQTFAGEGDTGRDRGQEEGGRRGGFRGGGGGRGQGNREGGGFRIRLSDNEMRATRALQEAFNLRSTVAVLGFAVRTLGQMLEDGELDALVEQQRSQAPRGGGRREGGRGEGRDGGRGGWRGEGGRGEGGRGSRPDPFARPAKPQPAAPELEAEVSDAAAVEAETAVETDTDTRTDEA